MTAQHFNGFTPLPPYPTPDMPDDSYNAAAYATTAAYPLMISEMTAAAAVVENNANLSEQQAGEASQAAQAAAATLIDVKTAANGAFAAASYKGDWVNLTGALNVPATVTHLGRLWHLKLNLANVTTQAPALGSAYWGEVSRNDFTVLPCPAGTTNAADRGLYRMTAASSVLLLPAAPWHGMVVAAANVSGTLTPVISRNGKTICGDAEDYLMNQLGWQIMLQFDSASNDWVRISGVTAYTAAQPAIASANTWLAPQNFSAGLSAPNVVGLSGVAVDFASIPFNAEGSLSPATEAANSAAGMPALARNGPYWWQVRKTGDESRGLAIAVQVFSGGGNGRMFVNTVHDKQWNGWVEK